MKIKLKWPDAVKTFGDSLPWGPWVGFYSSSKREAGVMVSTGSRDIALSFAWRGRAALIAWHFAQPHTFIGDYVRQWPAR